MKTERDRLLKLDALAKAELEKKKQKEGWGSPVEKKKAKLKVVEIEDDEPRNKTAFEELDELLDEQFLNMKLLTEENARLTTILETPWADKQLVRALADVRIYRDELNLLQIRFNQLQAERNEAVQYAQACKKRLKKLKNVV